MSVCVRKRVCPCMCVCVCACVFVCVCVCVCKGRVRQVCCRSDTKVRVCMEGGGGFIAPAALRCSEAQCVAVCCSVLTCVS